MSTAISLRSSQPVYYHREYKNDIPNVKSEESQESSLADQCKRVALVALPFISLYKPLSFPLSLAMGGLRTVTCVQQLLESIRSGNSKEIPYAMLQTAIAVIALAGTIFAHPLGMLISTGHDLIIDVVHLMEHLKNGEYQKAMEDCLGIINNALYLALFLHGGLEIGIASLAMQIFIGLYHSQAEFRKGHYIEGAGHLLMSMVRGNQLAGQAKILQEKRKIEELLKTMKSRDSKKNTISSSAYSKKQINSQNMEIDLRTVPPEDANEVARLILKYTDRINGGSPTYHAAKANDFDAVKLLLKYGGSPQEAFHGALSGRSMPILKYLIEDIKISIAAINSDGWYIHWSPEWWEGLDYLLGKGVIVPNLDYFFSNLSNQWTPNQRAPNILTGLINRGSKFSSDASNTLSNSFCLFFSDRFDRELRIRMLQSLNRECKFPIDLTYKLRNQQSRNLDACTPLIFAVINNDLELAKAILMIDADPNLGAYNSGTRGSTPMWYATKLTKNIEMIALLISCGAKVDT